MTAWLRRQGQGVNHKRVRRLMRLMGLEAIYPKPRLSLSNQAHKKYPYLLSTLAIDHPDQVWCADITYIRMVHGFVYSYGYYGLVQPFCCCLGDLNYPGYSILHIGLRTGPGVI